MFSDFCLTFVQTYWTKFSSDKIVVTRSKLVNFVDEFSSDKVVKYDFDQEGEILAHLLPLN